MGTVTIGSNVFLRNVQLYTATHPLDAELRKIQENITSPLVMTAGLVAIRLYALESR
jgi:acetyltransferase-like isoleucine patch superfamily enzyme